jgi:hypothetical protein
MSFPSNPSNIASPAQSLLPASFRAPKKQDDQRRAMFTEIDSITGTVIQDDLLHAFADGFMLSQVAQTDFCDRFVYKGPLHVDPSVRSAIAERYLFRRVLRKFRLVLERLPAYAITNCSQLATMCQIG